MPKYILIFLSVMGLLSSCTDIIEEEIDDQEIILLAPSDLLRTKVIQHTFWWEEVDGATQYRLQMVSPNFNAIEKLVLDTLVSGDKFSYTMVPGNYQWRVRGENSNSATAFTTASLIIDSTLDISEQQIDLLSPIDGLATNDLSQGFEWQDIYNADSYTIEIRRNSENGSLLSQADNIEEAYFNFEFTEEGVFYWKVQGHNVSSNTSTPFSSNSILIDTTAPDVPSLSNPNDNEFINAASDDLYTLEWACDEAENGTSAVSCLLYVSNVNAPSFNGINPIELIANGTSLTYTVELDDLGEYYWKVKTIDEAGNESDSSETYSFTIQ